MVDFALQIVLVLVSCPEQLSKSRYVSMSVGIPLRKSYSCVNVTVMTLLIIDNSGGTDSKGLFTYEYVNSP